MTDPVPPIPVSPARRSLWDRMSLVWLVPLAALAVALGVAWQSIRDQGPLIEIVFEDAAGIVARETELRYRNVTVGLVERVQFSPDLNHVVVSVRVEPEIAGYVDEDAQFWVVRPEITPQRITGIETVLSGVYIEGSWDSVPGEIQDLYQGSNTAPLLRPGEQGLEIVLRSTDGTLTSAMPVLFQGVTVGQVGTPTVGEDGVSVTAPAVIYAPYDRLVTKATVFWDASGFSLSVGSAGAEVSFDSLSSLIVGGLAFGTFVSSDIPAEDGDLFQAFLYEEYARDSIYTDPDAPTLNLMAVFTDEIAGLAVGSPVEVEGLRVGEVTSVNALVDEARFGDSEIHLQATLALQPTRLGITEEEGGAEAILAWLQDRVNEGLRARLATAGLLGGLKVQLATLPNLAPAGIDLDAQPYPALPVAASEITDFAASAEGLINRVDELPIEQLLDSAIGFLDNASLLVGSDDTQAIPAEVRALLGDVRDVTASEEVQQLPAQLAQTLAEIDATVTEVRAILTEVREQDAIARVLAAVDAAEATLQQVGAAAEGVPSLLAQLESVAAKAEALEVESLLAEITGLSADARALVNQPGLQTLPNRIALATDRASSALLEAQAILESANAAELGPRLASTLDAAQSAAQGIETAVAGAPELIDRLSAVAAKAQALEVEPLLQEVTGLSTEARALLAQPGLQELPARLGTLATEAETALSEARAILSGLNEGDLATRLSAAIRSAEAAAAAIEDSAEGIPQIVERIDALVAKANELPVDQLVTELTSLATSANTLVSAESTQALPADLSAALAEVEALLREAREGGVVTNANAVLLSARTAADTLPGLVNRAGTLLDQAAGTLSGFDETSSIVREAQAAIQEVAAAAQAIADLARAIERNPNSLIFGD